MGQRIGIVGAGRVGTTLGGRWAEAGHDVRYGVRDPEDGRHERLRHHATAVAVPDAAHDVDVVLLAVPWAVAIEVASGLGPLGDAVVLDATNPLAGRTHAPDATRSGAEQLREVLDGGRLVKAFNTTGSANMDDPAGYEPAPTAWLAGDDDGALSTAGDLARDLGFAPVVAGDLTAARDLEHLAALWIRLAYALGHGPDVAVSLTRRSAR